jgi:hypothetical protein
MKRKPKSKSRRSYTTRDYNHLMSAITPTRAIWWKVSGIFYGYPQCCIEAFCRLDHIKEESKTGSKALASLMGKNTGFIPCRQCAEKISTGELKLQDLISGRKSPTAFPKCSNDDMDLIYEMIST